MIDPQRIEALLEKRPDLEAPLGDILEVDADRETWIFEDIPVESRPVGELVGRDVVEKIGGEYSLANPSKR